MAKLLLQLLGILILAIGFCFAQVPDPSTTEVEASGDMNTTSAVPSPTTTPTSPPTSPPPTSPSPEVYVLANSNATVCVYLNVTISFLVQYLNTSDQNVTIQIVPSNASLVNTSYCNSVTANMSLSWKLDTENYIMYFVFSAAPQNNNWLLTSVNVSIPGEAFKNAEYPVGVIDAGIDNIMEKQSFNLSYRCDTDRKLPMTVHNVQNASHYSVQLNISYFQVQAFQFSNYTAPLFDEFSRCADDIKGSKIVPIAVGAALAGLVIIVLIAYIIGRLRSRKQGSYEALS